MGFNPSSIGKALKRKKMDYNHTGGGCFNPSSIGKALKSDWKWGVESLRIVFQSIFNWKSLKKKFYAARFRAAW